VKGEAPRTVIVTGGARRIGAVIARALADDGWRVAIHHHHSELDREVLCDLADVAPILTGDLADPATPAALIAGARAAFGGPVGAVVNSASMFAYDRPPLENAESLRAHASANLHAPVLLASQLAAQDDLAAGAVVNILDQKLANLNPDFFSYSCAKAGLAAATVMLAQGLGPRIRVNAVAPGISLPSGDQSEAEFRAVASRNLLRKPVDVGDVARAVAFLLSARGITGQTVFVDNGQRFLPKTRDVMFETRA
jgi:NAD(P)-dependent dehydrogenase (short-subunit alcohol dehydrogenase family)